MADGDRLLPDGWLPKREWFTDVPNGMFDGNGATHLTLITDGPDIGRFYAVVADSRSCYSNDTNRCWTPPPSQIAGAMFNVAEIDTDDGPVLAGPVTMSGGHPTGIEQMTADEARQVHEDTGGNIVFGTYYDLEVTVPDWPEPFHAAVILGAANPSITVDEAESVRGGGSGEWFPSRYQLPDGSVGESMELVAFVAVNTPAIQVGMPERVRALRDQAPPEAMAAARTVVPAPVGWVRYENGPMVGPHATPTTVAPLVASVGPRRPVATVVAACGCDKPATVGEGCGCATSASDTEHDEPIGGSTMETITEETPVEPVAVSPADLFAGMSETDLAAAREFLAGPVTEEERLRAIVSEMLDARDRPADQVAAATDPEDGTLTVDGGDGPERAELDPEDETRITAIETKLDELTAVVVDMVASMSDDPAEATVEADAA